MEKVTKKRKNRVNISFKNPKSGGSILIPDQPLLLGKMKDNSFSFHFTRKHKACALHGTQNVHSYMVKWYIWRWVWEWLWCGGGDDDDDDHGRKDVVERFYLLEKIFAARVNLSFSFILRWAFLFANLFKLLGDIVSFSLYILLAWGLLMYHNTCCHATTALRPPPDALPQFYIILYTTLQFLQWKQREVVISMGKSTVVTSWLAIFV